MSSPSSRPKAVLSCERLEDRLALDAASFVTGLYQNLLNRAPTANGLAFWVNQINNGLSHFQVAQDIWRSTEHRGIEVDFYYTHFLGRNADPVGRAFWVREMLSGMSELQVAALFLTSGEYIASHSTPDAYVTGLYADVLARSPGLSELNFWDNVLAADGPGTVAVDILTSNEAYIGIINNDYQTYLGRTPDTIGLNTWLTDLRNGTATVETVAEAILASAEYAAKH
jgi:hypothetical protein